MIVCILYLYLSYACHLFVVVFVFVSYSFLSYTCHFEPPRHLQIYNGIRPFPEIGLNIVHVKDISKRANSAWSYLLSPHLTRGQNDEDQNLRRKLFWYSGPHLIRGQTDKEQNYYGFKRPSAFDFKPLLLLASPSLSISSN